MRITAELIAALLKRCNPEQLPQELEYLQKVHEQLVAIETRRRKEIENHDEVLRKLDAELTAVQQTCPHTLWRHFGDASGGRDSFSRCELCGAELP